MRVELENVTKHYGGVPALAAVSTAFQPGTIYAILGLNGAGKTTLLHSLAGVLALQGGEVRFDGEPLQRARLDQRRRFFFLPDFPTTFAEQDVLQYLSFVLRAYERETGPATTERIADLLEEFDLVPLAERRFSELSRGQSYKAALIALLACDCELWLLDEPFASGMDARGLHSFKRHAAIHAEKGGTVIFTTQIVETLPDFAQSVVLLDHGALRTAGPLDSIEAEGQFGAGALELLLSRRAGEGA